MASSATGAAWCWGGNYQGQLGEGFAQYNFDPVPVQGGQTFTALGSGSTHTCGIQTSGAGSSGEQGNRRIDNVLVPTPPSRPSGWSGPRSSGGWASAFTCGLDTSGAAWCWGNNLEERLGWKLTATAATPVQVVGLPRP